MFGKVSFELWICPGLIQLVSWLKGYINLFTHRIHTRVRPLDSKARKKGACL